MSNEAMTTDGCTSRRPAQAGCHPQTGAIRAAPGTPTDRANTDTHRLLRLAVQTLARPLLSCETAAEPMARLLRHAIRHRRNQQHLLQTTRGIDLRRLQSACPDRIRVRREGQPLAHAHA